MKTASALACAALLQAVLLALGCLARTRDSGASEAITLDFDASVVGTLPTGFLSAVTGGGGPASWIVVEDGTAPSGSQVVGTFLKIGALSLGTVVVLVLWRLSPLPLMAGGAAIGFVLRARLS